jgi:hypothetical protein
VTRATHHPAGHRLFARYACAPNALGHCGPPEGGAALEAVACGRPTGADVPSIARRFSGAWPYQSLIAQLAGIDDPLDARVGRAYWTGNALTRQIDGRRLGELLLERFAAQAGHYWSHLTADLLDEVTPTHAFHVLAVYPWTRLLAAAPDEPLRVLNACRIRPAEVLELRADAALVCARTLTWDGFELGLSRARDELVTWRSASGTFADGLQEGARVALHWGHVCDELTPGEAGELAYWTELQVEAANRRLDRRPVEQRSLAR